MVSRPFQFCRYEIRLGDEVLNATGQRSFFLENQGIPVPYKSWGSEQDDSSIRIMEPRTLAVSGYDAISALIGLQPGVRTVIGYDSENQKRTRADTPDAHIKTAHLVLVPDLNAIAIQDRNNDLCIPASTATRIMRAMIRGFFGNDSDFSLVRLSNAEIRNAMEQWALTEYSYTIRPLNPVTLSDLTNLRSDKMKDENIARESAKLKSGEGEAMHANGGPISQTQEMVEEGYGQNGFSGVTPDGHKGVIPKPAFHMEKEKNLAEQAKPRPVRMAFDVEDYDAEEHDLSPTIAQALVNFFGPNG
jgi:hypothetical protein